jgi:hypothetical protein
MKPMLRPNFFRPYRCHVLGSWSLAAVSAWAVLAAFALVSPLSAGTFSSSTTAPAVNASDIANLATQTGSDKWFFQTANESGVADAAKGQTFTSKPSAVQLKALTYKISAGNMKGAPTTYVVRVGTVSGTTFTQVASETFSQTADTPSGAYMKWTFATPIMLLPSTLYGIDVVMDSGVAWGTGIPYLSISGNVATTGVGTMYDSGDAGVANNTLVFTTANDRVFHLDMEDPQQPSPTDGAQVPAGNVVLSWANLAAITGTNVWVDVWYGTNASALTKVISAGLNTTTHTVSAPTGATYYWRVDTYRNGVSTGTPATGTRFSFIVSDSDADGLPDAYELLHTTPASATALRPGDDLDSDGLTNMQEYTRGTLPRDADTDNDTLNDGPELTGVAGRPATNPLLADTDADGVNDGAESHTGTWVSATNTGTNPIVKDTDVDGLSDGAETNSGTFTSATNTGTHPLRTDSDNDGAGDWYEVAASFTNPTQASSKPNVPYPLPDPDASTGVTTKPVKVFILSGQSNMVGFGRVAGSEAGTLQTLTGTEKKFPNLVTSTNTWTTRNDVRYRGVISALGNAPLTVGFGADTDSFGPELGFGHVVGWFHDEPVLIIKTSIGNRALGWDFLPPGSVPYTYNGTVYSGYGDYTQSYATGGTPLASNGWYAGKQYDDSFLAEADMGPKAWASGIAYVASCQVKRNGVTYISKIAHTSAAANEPGVGANWATNWSLYAVTNVTDILDNFGTQYPQWAAQGFEIAGFGWFQGWNDGQSTTTAWANHYEQNLVRLIKHLRSYYTARYPTKIKANAPFVVATCGFDGFAAAGNRLTLVNAQLAVGDSTSYPEFAGNVRSMEARGYWKTSGPNLAQNYHYYHHAETFMLVGDAMGRGMVELLNPGPAAGSFAAWKAKNSAAATATGDHDGDQVPNGIEWFVHGDATASGFTALPGVVNTAGTLSVRWMKAATFTGVYGTDFSVESAQTLTGPWTTEALGTNVAITGNEVRFTFPSPLGQVKFVRLKVRSL